MFVSGGLGKSIQIPWCEWGNLASTYWDQGRRKDAEELQLQVSDTHLRVSRVEHPDTLLAMENLVATCLYQGQWKEAEDLQLQGRDARLGVSGSKHPYTLLAMDAPESRAPEGGRGPSNGRR